MDAADSGPILRHGVGPDRCDFLGAREAICFRFKGTYYLHYDGAGPTGWRSLSGRERGICGIGICGVQCWIWGRRAQTMRGRRARLGRCSTASGGTCFMWARERQRPRRTGFRQCPTSRWRRRARIRRGRGGNKMWFRSGLRQGTYYADTASPGQVVKLGDEYRMFFSAAAYTDESPREIAADAGDCADEEFGWGVGGR